jgi:hypothetical protein
LPDWDIYGQRNPFSHYWKTAPEKIRVVFYNVGSVLVKLILRKGERPLSRMLMDRKK